MKLTLQHHHVRSSDELDSLIEDRILSLQPRLPIEEANVSLECRFVESPPFTVRVQLVIPGPDLVAEGKDHTLEAAFGKAMLRLHQQIVGRFRKRLQRVKSNLSTPTAKSRPGLNHSRCHSC